MSSVLFMSHIWVSQCMRPCASPPPGVNRYWHKKEHVYPRRRWERGRPRNLWWQPHRATVLLRGLKKKNSYRLNIEVRLSTGPVSVNSPVHRVTQRCHQQHLMTGCTVKSCSSVCQTQADINTKLNFYKKLRLNHKIKLCDYGKEMQFLKDALPSHRK